MEFIRARVELH
jgi:hypothetical protein